MQQTLILLLLSSLLLACGGGGGGGGGSTPPPPGGSTPPPPAPVAPTQAELEQAASFLRLTTFGASYDEIEQLAREDVDTWLQQQFARPATSHLNVVVRYGDEYGYDPNGPITPGLYRRFAFWESAVNGDDQLRQLVAYALGQIFVVSDNVGMLFNDPTALSSYHDTLAAHAFGNFRDLLLAVTLHPAMGVYLSHVNNGRSDPLANTFPDENYAREVMQLFSIGLFELNADGTQVLDTAGNPIPTYDNADIREFSKIFTGLSYGPAEPGGSSFFGKRAPVLYVPMEMFEEFHEPGEKFLLNGQVVPDGQSGMRDVEDAIDNLFNHPNVGPFIGRQLIQRLVTSNPSPEYVARVSAAFAGDGVTPRGDMRAVLRAILLDPEAASASRLQEPFRRYVALNRILQSAAEDGSVPGAGFVAQFLTQQHVLSAPSVFNFYLPNFSPSGVLGDAGLVSPEFQITNASTVVGVTNLVAYALFAEQSIDSPEELGRPITPNFSEFEALAADPDALLDRIDLLFFAGNLGDSTRQILRTAIEGAGPDPTLRVQVGLYLALASPEGAVVGGQE